MELRILTLFNAFYVPKGKRISEKAFVPGQVQVLIREIRSEDTVPAHLIHHVPVDRGRARYAFASTDGEPCQVLHYEDAFWARRELAARFKERAESEMEQDDAAATNHPFRGTYESYEDNGEGQEVRVLRREGLNQGLHFTGEPMVVSGPHQVEEKIGVEVRKWKIDDQRAFACFTRRAESFICVDGTVFERVGEPVICLKEDKNQIGIYIEEDVEWDDGLWHGHRHSRDGNIRTMRFGIDEFERAASFATDLSKQLGKKVVSTATRVDVSPWAVGFRGEHQFFKTAAQAAVMRLSDHVYAMPREMGKAWHDLSVALAENFAPTHAAIDAARRLTAHEAELDRWSIGEMDRYFVASAFHALQDALKRWDTRSPNGLDWFDKALGVTATHGPRGMRAYEISSMAHAQELVSKLGDDVMTMAHLASAGSGHLVAVNQEEQVTSLVLIGNGPDGDLQIVQQLPEKDLGPQIRDLVLEHVRVGRDNRVASDAELEAFGI